jgi:hypothetical protein
LFGTEDVACRAITSIGTDRAVGCGAEVPDVFALYLYHALTDDHGATRTAVFAAFVGVAVYAIEIAVGTSHRGHRSRVQVADHRRKFVLDNYFVAWLEIAAVL